MKISQAQWAGIRQRFLDGAARQGVRLRLRDRVWAETENGEWVALPGTSDSPVADRWWLGCDPEKLRTRRPLGIVLLCQARGGSLHAIGLPGSTLREIGGRLGRNARQIFFNVVRRGERFLLQLPGGGEFDVSEHVNDLSWVSNAQPTDVVLGAYSPTREHHAIFAETPDGSADRSGSETAVTGKPSATIEPSTARFFAMVKNGALHPLDDVALEPGSLYLVEICIADAVPGSRSLRRILARGGPMDLPTDLAERHDHYAHRAGRS